MPPRRGAQPRAAFGSLAGSAACVALLLLLPFALFGEVTLGAKVFADGDLGAYNYPLVHEIARQWRAGRVPLWHPAIFGGTPLLAQMQGGAFYPPNALHLVLPPWIAFGHTILLHFGLAGVFTFAYLRGLALSRTAAVAGGLVFMLGGFAMSHLGHVSTLRNVPWLPLMLLGFDRWRVHGDRRGIALGAGATGLLLLSGHPQIPLYALLVTIAYGAWFALRCGAGARLQAAAGLVAILGIGMLIGAVQWLTTWAAVPEYVRPASDYGYFVHFSQHPVMLANLVFPGLVPCDGAEQTGYVGVAGLLLAGVGAFVPSRRAEDHRLFFRALAIVSLPLVLGGYTPLSRLLFQVPLFRAFTAPARHWFEFCFAASVLAALGFDALRSSPERARAWAARALLGLGAAALIALLGVAYVRALALPLPEEASSLLSGAFPWEAVRGRLVWIAASAAVLCGFGVRSLVRPASLLAPLVLAADLFAFNGYIYPRDEPRVFREPPRSLEAMRGEPGPFRVLGLEQPEGTEQYRECLGHNLAGVWGVETLNGFDSLMLRAVTLASGHAMPTWGLVAGRDAYGTPQFQRFMDLLNARYVLVPAAKEHDLPGPRYTPIQANRHVKIYRNEEALPRLFLVSAARSVTQAQAIETLASGLLDGRPFDPRRLALVEAAADLGLPSADGVSLPAQALRLMPGDVEASVESPSGGVLIHATNFTSGWSATVDGARAGVMRVDGFVQGVAVPPGRHVVRFRYRPGAFAAGGALSLAGIALAVFVSRRSSQ